MPMTFHEAWWALFQWPGLYLLKPVSCLNPVSIKPYVCKSSVSTWDEFSWQHISEWPGDADIKPPQLPGLRLLLCASSVWPVKRRRWRFSCACAVRMRMAVWCTSFWGVNGGVAGPQFPQQVPKNGIRSHLESAETHTLRHQGWGKCLHSFFEGDMGAESPLKVKSSNLETAFPGSIQEGKFHSLGGSQFTEPQCHSDSCHSGTVWFSVSQTCVKDLEGKFICSREATYGEKERRALKGASILRISPSTNPIKSYWIAWNHILQLNPSKSPFHHVKSPVLTLKSPIFPSQPGFSRHPWVAGWIPWVARSFLRTQCHGFAARRRKGDWRWSSSNVTWDG